MLDAVVLAQALTWKICPSGGDKPPCTSFFHMIISNYNMEYKIQKYHRENRIT